MSRNVLDLGITVATERGRYKNVSVSGNKPDIISIERTKEHVKCCPFCFYATAVVLANKQLDAHF